VLLEGGGELRQLGDRDALVADPLEMDRAVQHREHETQVAGHGRLLGEQLADRPLDAVIPLVDLVVEGDHLVTELDVLRLERVDRPAHRAEDDLALLLEVGLEGVEARLVLEACHQCPDQGCGRARDPQGLAGRGTTTTRTGP
jgi:hypothetical protein